MGFWRKFQTKGNAEGLSVAEIEEREAKAKSGQPIKSS